jgi:hypothetical protein
VVNRDFYDLALLFMQCNADGSKPWQVCVSLADNNDVI